MAGLTRDCRTIRYGVGDGDDPRSYPIGASEKLYSGAVALVSGSGSVAAGYLKNAAEPGADDIVVGMVGDAEGGAYAVSPGLPTGTTDGAVWAGVLTGAFFFQSGTGSDQLDASTNGRPVYYGGENELGPIACATDGSASRPVLGTQIPQDPGIASGSSPGPNYWPIDVRKGP